MSELTDEANQQQTDRQMTPESLPNSKYKIQIAFGPHATAKDAEVLHAPIGACDVFIPEFALWKEEGLRMWNDVSAGKIPPKDMTERYGDAGFMPYQERVLELLHNSGKKVALIDIPAEHPLEKEKEDLDRKHHELSVDLPSFEEVLDAREAYYRLEADWIRRREDHMVDYLPFVIAKTTDHDPELSQKEAINVLLSLGTAHTRVLSELRRLGFSVQEPIFPLEGEVLGWKGEATKSGIFNQPFDRTVLARDLIERMVRKHVGNTYGGDFRRLTREPIKIVRLMRKLVGDFTYEDCEAIWQQRKDPFGVYYPFRSMYELKGLRAPKDEGELDRILAQDKPVGGPEGT